MPVQFSDWRPLDASEIARAPESPGVFEIATLVRTVLFIGVAPDSLSAALTQHVDTPGRPGGYTGRKYFRFHPADDAEKLRANLLNEYRERHGGSLPPAQTAPSQTPRPVRHLKAV